VDSDNTAGTTGPLPDQVARDRHFMARAVELASRGIGGVEPNPPVGCLIVREGRLIAEGWHTCFGGPHAEVMALRALGGIAQGATMYVTLEPCCHHGKTPPCTDAILQAGVCRVVVAVPDPFPQVAGQGIARLRDAGVVVDLLPDCQPARDLVAPYLKLIARRRPWVIAKWAMTLDGKLATRSGDSQWISNAASRRIVHQLRGRVDAILVGRRTVEADDPLLTARPPGPRQAVRVVVDSMAAIDPRSKLVASARDIPVVIATGPEADRTNLEVLRRAGCELLQCPAHDPAARITQLLDTLGERQMTNVLVEGGGNLLGSLFDLQEVDEVHVFIAPKLVGGATATTPVGGRGVATIADALQLADAQLDAIEGDAYIHGRVRR